LVFIFYKDSAHRNKSRQKTNEETKDIEEHRQVIYIRMCVCVYCCCCCCSCVCRTFPRRWTDDND